MDRRSILKSAALVAAGVAATAAPAAAASKSRGPVSLAATDGTPLFHRDWGTGKPIVLLSAWGTSSDFWEYMMMNLVDRGRRCIVYDRRGHGRSGDPGRGYDFDTLSDDLAKVLATLDLQDVTLVAHSMGACEAVRYLSRHGAARISNLVLLAPVTPFLLKTADNPDGIDGAFFEKFRATLKRDRAKWLADNSRPFFMPDTSDAILQWGLNSSLQSSLQAMVECNRAFTSTDFRPDCRAVSIPTLILHGDKDVSALLPLTSRKTAALIKGSVLKVYEGAPHGLPFTHFERVNDDILEFIGAKPLPAK
jgi:pimeloyl-ACP methyl ester carboxylesterase